jgi:sugar phosphate isomerase/epimerase
MKLGVYTAVLHDRPLRDALDVIVELGLEAAEINSGGFLPPVHIPLDDVLASQSARDDYLGVFDDKGVSWPDSTRTGIPCTPTRRSARSTPTIFVVASRRPACSVRPGW